MTRRTLLLLLPLAFLGGFSGFMLAPHLGHVFARSEPCPTDLHYSFYSTSEVFDEAYKGAGSSTPSTGSIKGITVNHHLLAANLIASMFNRVATEKPLTVVLISPNHFDVGDANAISSVYEWQTPYGVLASDCHAIESLARTGLVSIEEGPFKNEHGVSGIVPFIKRSLPNARVVPLIVKDSMPPSERERLANALYAEFGPNALIVGSFDFSHYLPDQASDFHDAKTIAALDTFDYEGIQALDTDSAPGVEVMLRLLERMKAKRFDVVAHTNSSKVLADTTIEQGTSYIDGTFSLGAARENHTATILAFGDLMLDRNVRKAIEKDGAMYPFVPLTRFLIGSDIVVANAEGPFTHNAPVIFDHPEDLKFTFDLANLPTLKKLGFTLLGQANNHALNFGADGLKESQDAIQAAGIGTFGNPLNTDPGPLYQSVRGTKVAFVGYHQFNGNDTKVLAAIQQAKGAGAFVIVYPHWGEEYNEGVIAFQTKEAHAFIDAGADLILGAHPHVIEPIEIYRGKAIFYSLGNFVFDQRRTGPTAEGLSVGVVLTPERVSYTLFPLSLEHAQVSLMPYARRSTLEASMATRAMLPSENEGLRSGIAHGTFTLER